MNIAYDARLSLGRYRGMGHFLRQLIAGREQEFLGLCADGERDSTLNLHASGFRPYPIWEQLSIPRLIRAKKVEVFLAPYNSAPLRMPAETKLVLIVHDLIFLDHLAFSRSMYQNAGRWYRRVVMPLAIKRADVVVTVSNHTARQLVTRFGVDKRRLRVIPNSVGEEWFTSQRCDARGHYVLTVTGEAPSKNLDRAIAAFALCRKVSGDSKLRMKVAGVTLKYHAAFQARARECGVADSIDFLGYVSVAQMRHLYRRAELFLMPSLAEGFGIPVLEAMASGVPVAASAGTALKEVAGDAALYFDPTSIESMATTIDEILGNRTLQAEMSERGWVRARSFHPVVVGKYVRDFWAELEEAAQPTRRRDKDQWARSVC